MAGGHRLCDNTGKGKHGSTTIFKFLVTVISLLAEAYKTVNERIKNKLQSKGIGDKYWIQTNTNKTHKKVPTRDTKMSANKTQ